MFNPLSVIRLILFVLAVLAAIPNATCQQAAVRPPDQLRVLTYNIHHGEGTDGELDLQRIANVIQSVDPDIVALQEVDRNVPRSNSTDQTAVLGEMTGMQAIFGGNLDLNGGKYGNALLTRLPIVAHQNQLLPVINDGEQRGILISLLWFYGRPIRVIVTHLDHRPDPQERLAAVEQLNRLLLQTPQVPSLLAGDINATRQTEVLQGLTQQWTIAGPERWTIPVAMPQRQIDFVFYRPQSSWKVIETAVLEEAVASDHRAFFAVLQLVETDAERTQRHARRANVLSTPTDDGRGTAETPEQWQTRRRKIELAVESVMGRLPLDPQREPPAYRVLKETDAGNYVRKKIEYESQPGGWTPAWLCIPKKVLESTDETAAAILCLHPTDNQIGHDVVVGLGGRANRQYAAELAERGYVTLAPSYPLLAEYQPDLEQLGFRAGTLKAVFDNIRGIDLLQSLEEVDSSAIGAIGHSLGGHNAVYTAFHDPRIDVVVTSCGLDSYQDYYGGDPERWLPEQGWCQTRYMPELARYRGRLADIPFDFHELLASIAPRHVMVIAPLHDSNFRAASVDRLTEQARRVYALHGHPRRLQVLHPDCEHDFPEPMRRRAYELFDEVLK